MSAMHCADGVDAVVRLTTGPIHSGQSISMNPTPQWICDTRAITPSTQSTKPTMAMISAAVALPEPVKRGFNAIIFLALRALEMAMGSRMIPTQKIPMMAYFKASSASSTRNRGGLDHRLTLEEPLPYHWGAIVSGHPC